MKRVNEIAEEDYDLKYHIIERMLRQSWAPSALKCRAVIRLLCDAENMTDLERDLVKQGHEEYLKELYERVREPGLPSNELIGNLYRARYLRELTKNERIISPEEEQVWRDILYNVRNKIPKWTPELYHDAQLERYRRMDEVINLDHGFRLSKSSNDDRWFISKDQKYTFFFRSLVSRDDLLIRIEPIYAFLNPLPADGTPIENVANHVGYGVAVRFREDVKPSFCIEYLDGVGFSRAGRYRTEINPYVPWVPVGTVNEHGIRQGDMFIMPIRDPEIQASYIKESQPVELDTLLFETRWKLSANPDQVRLHVRFGPWQMEDNECRIYVVHFDQSIHIDHDDHQTVALAPRWYLVSQISEAIEKGGSKD